MNRNYIFVIISLMLLLIATSVTAAPMVDYRWLDVADQVYSAAYRGDFTYDSAQVSVYYEERDLTFNGTLTAVDMKPNFAYQVKLVGEPGTDANERIGLTGRWWQEEWNGMAWINEKNLNDKGDGSSPNPNDDLYFARRDVVDTTSPTGLKYKYVGYLMLDYFITEKNGNAELAFEADSSYHVLWKTSQRTWSNSDGALVSTTFDADNSPAYEDSGGDDFPLQTVEIFGEWERLPVGGVLLDPGDYQAEFILTEESFHGSGGTYAGNWAQVLNDPVTFTIAERVSETLHLSPGWNLVTLPILPESVYTAQALLDDINDVHLGSCSEIDRWHYDNWDAHIDGLTFNDFDIIVGEGYFIKCATHSDWIVEGMAPWEEADVTLSAGWSLLGIPYPPNSYTAQSLLDKLKIDGKNCSEVDRWLYDTWDAHVDGLSYNDYAIESDQGYFFKCVLGE